MAAKSEGTTLTSKKGDSGAAETLSEGSLTVRAELCR